MKSPKCLQRRSEMARGGLQLLPEEDTESATPVAVVAADVEACGGYCLMIQLVIVVFHAEGGGHFYVLEKIECGCLLCANGGYCGGNVRLDDQYQSLAGLLTMFE